MITKYKYVIKNNTARTGDRNNNPKNENKKSNILIIIQA